MYNPDLDLAIASFYNHGMNVLRKVLIGLLIILLLVTGGFVFWGLTPSPPMPEALAAMQSDSALSVSCPSSWYEFKPAGSSPDTGFIFYPGGHVDARAYAPLARELARNGYLVILPPMPLNLAVLAPNTAGKVIAAHPEVRRWVLGGHSLGGAMAANFVRNHPGKITGLALLASYPAASDDLSSVNVKSISIYATQDGLATAEKIAASRALLPSDTRWVEIIGGNHAGFGWYGNQPGDKPASISREEQQRQVVSALTDFLTSLKESP